MCAKSTCTRPETHWASLAKCKSSHLRKSCAARLLQYFSIGHGMANSVKSQPQMRLGEKITNCISLSRIVKFSFPINFEIGRVLCGRVIPHMRARKGQLWSKRIEIEEALEIAVDGLTHQNQSCWSSRTFVDETLQECLNIHMLIQEERHFVPPFCVVHYPAHSGARHDYNLVHQDKPARDRLTHRATTTITSARACYNNSTCPALNNYDCLPVCYISTISTAAVVTDIA